MEIAYLYGKLPLKADTSKPCYLSLVGGKTTGTLRFMTGFYGITTMPADFHCVSEAIHSEFPCAHAFTGISLKPIATLEKFINQRNRMPTIRPLKAYQVFERIGQIHPRCRELVFTMTVGRDL